MDEHVHVHEGSDVHARPLIIFFVVFLVFSVIAFALVKWSYGALVKFENARQRDRITQVAAETTTIPESLHLRAGGPEVTTLPATGALLQPDPVRDMNVMREAQLGKLNSYGWIDKDRGTVHVPIDKAMAMTLERTMVKAQAAEPAGAATQPMATPAASAAAAK